MKTNCGRIEKPCASLQYALSQYSTSHVTFVLDSSIVHTLESTYVANFGVHLISDSVYSVCLC